MVKPWLAAAFTATAPAGVIEPFAPALAVIVYVLIAKLALITWLARTFVKLYVVTAPTLMPSTSTSAT